jgi:hypothetical protein
MTKENATSGKLVAGTAVSTNGYSAHAHSTTVFSVGSRAIWRNSAHDQPVVLSALLGEHGGERFWGIEGSATGVPESQLVADHSADLLGELGALLAEAKVEPADAMTAGKVQPVIDLVATYQGIARQAGIEALTRLIGHLPTEERRRLNLYSGDLFVTGKQVEGFLAQCPPPPGAPKFAPKSLADLLAMPPKRWLIDQIIGAGDLSMLYGPPGSGKSFVVIDLIFAGCLGQSFARRFDTSRRLTVAYCAGEGASGLPQRFAAAAEHYGVSALPSFTFFDAAPQLFTGEVADAYSASIGEFVREWQQRQAAGAAGQLDLLVIDTMHSATIGADENSAQDMGKVLQATKAAVSALGCAVMLVHHSNKQGNAERGSSALRGAMDCMIEVKPTAGKFLLSCEKLKDGQQWKAQTFDLLAAGDTESVRVWWDEVGGDGKSNKQNQDVEALLALLKGAGGARHTATSLAEAIGIGGSKQIFKLLPQAMKAEPGIKCGLKHPSKDASPHNPMMYWYAPENGSSENVGSHQAGSQS